MEAVAVQDYGRKEHKKKVTTLGCLILMGKISVHQQWPGCLHVGEIPLGGAPLWKVSHYVRHPLMAGK